ncbi:MAG: lipid A biosynthesis acyltransferase [Betaproteobacteria bacterium]|nr:lipid A biosynthesis acyltransferase [Betaproteobacteria bacterium]
MVIVRRIGSWLAFALLWALHWLPTPALGSIGRSLGRILYRFGRGRVTDTNLALCFPDMPERERKALAQRHFEALGRSAIEMTLLWFGSDERLAGLVRLVGLEHLEGLRDKPLVVFAPHFVGVDVCGFRLAAEFPKSASIYSRPKNPVLDRLLLRGRLRLGSTILLPRQEGMRAIVKALREGRALYFLPDMDFGARDSIFSSFFGVPTATVTALPRLARLGRATVVPAVARQVAHGYEMRIYPPWTDYPSGDLEADVRRMNAFVEDRVREMPEQYFWAHKRFKTRPPGEPSPYRRK